MNPRGLQVAAPDKYSLSASHGYGDTVAGKAGEVSCLMGQMSRQQAYRAKKPECNAQDSVRVPRVSVSFPSG